MENYSAVNNGNISSYDLLIESYGENGGCAVLKGNYKDGTYDVLQEYIFLKQNKDKNGKRITEIH
jgi:hypothetical protein